MEKYKIGDKVKYRYDRSSGLHDKEGYDIIFTKPEYTIKDIKETTYNKLLLSFVEEIEGDNRIVFNNITYYYADYFENI